MDSEGKDYINNYDTDVYDLEVNQENFEILMKRMEMMDDYGTYQRIVNDFNIFLTSDLRKKIISKGIDTFGPEFAQNLDSYVQELDLSQENYEILMKRIEIMDDYTAYYRLLFDFDDFLTSEKRKMLISNMEKIFDEDIIKNLNLKIKKPTPQLNFYS